MRIARPAAAAVVVVVAVVAVIAIMAAVAAIPAPSSAAWSAACSARHRTETAKGPGATRAFLFGGRQFGAVGPCREQFYILVAARRQPAHLDFLAGRNRLG